VVQRSPRLRPPNPRVRGHQAVLPADRFGRQSRRPGAS
jgi:hypothetical protein